MKEKKWGPYTCKMKLEPATIGFFSSGRAGKVKKGKYTVLVWNKNDPLDFGDTYSKFGLSKAEAERYWKSLK